MLRFDDVLELKNVPVEEGEAVIDAMGPLNPSEEVMIELCAWVFQRGEHDAAATEMTTGGEHHETAHGGHIEFFEGADGQNRDDDEHNLLDHGCLSGRVLRSACHTSALYSRHPSLNLGGFACAQPLLPSSSLPSRWDRFVRRRIPSNPQPSAASCLPR